MTTQTFDPTEPVTPSEADATLARESARVLAPQLAEANGTMGAHRSSSAAEYEAFERSERQQQRARHRQGPNLGGRSRWGAGTGVQFFHAETQQ